MNKSVVLFVQVSPSRVSRNYTNTFQIIVSHLISLQVAFLPEQTFLQNAFAETT
jgi:hypothetical protein